MIPPHGATAEGTKQFAKHKKHVHADKFRQIADLTVSAVGHGTYLGNYDDATDSLYEEALLAAIEGGINLIDTAINYRCQRSERVIGRVLKNLFDKKQLKRSQVVVATKGGFIPFDREPAASMAAYVKKTWIDTGVVSEADIVSNCHCMHPDYLRRQIAQSLKNLGLDTIDIYYLHNPETQIPVVGAEVFYERLRKAFELLEDQVEQGKIQYYGMATWTGFREPAGVSEALSLEKTVELARQVGGEGHHFKVIQLPYNLAMLEAVSVHGQICEGNHYPILPVARSLDVAVVASASLLQGQLLNLPAPILQKMPGDHTPAQKALEFVSSTPSVLSALVGMKQVGHVSENLEVLKKPDWDLNTLKAICEVVVRR